VATEFELVLPDCAVSVADGSGLLVSTGFFVAPGWVMTTSFALSSGRTFTAGWPYHTSELNPVRQAIIEPLGSDQPRHLVGYVHPSIAVLEIGALRRHPSVKLEAVLPRDGDLLLSATYRLDTGDFTLVRFTCAAEPHSGARPLLELTPDLPCPLMPGAAVLNTRTGGVCAVLAESSDAGRADRAYAIPCQLMDFDLVTNLNLLTMNQAIHHRGERRDRARDLGQATAESSDTQEADQTDLLFRVFIPSERLYAAEAGRLLSLFRDWIWATRGHGVRQSEHWKPTGTIYEFFADASALQPDLRAEFDNFSGFLTLCSEDAPAAAEVITSTGVDHTTSVNLVARFGKEVRRLKTDLRHDREQRMLTIRHDLEDQLEEMGVDLRAIPSGQISALIESHVPDPSPGESLALLAVPWTVRPAPAGIVMNNPQIINVVQGTVIHSIRGDVHLGLQAREAMDFILEFGGQETANLQSAVYELENKNTPKAEKSKAKARLKKFLGGLAGPAKDVGTELLTKYLESKGF
jgi:hypothetical protein